MKTKLKAISGADRFFAAAATEGNDLEILLYDQIGYDFWTGGGVMAKDLAAMLKGAGDASRIVLRINSPGGDVFEGAAMYNLLSQSAIPVDVIVDGLAASAASYVAMAGKTVTMGQGAMMMIHNPWAIEIGDANAMRKMAETLDKVRDSMLSGYMNRFNGSEEELKNFLDEETWLTASDALALGLSDQTQQLPAKADEKEKAKALARLFDLSQYKNVPEELKPGKSFEVENESAAQPAAAEPAAPRIAAESRERAIRLAELA